MRTYAALAAVAAVLFVAAMAWAQSGTKLPDGLTEKNGVVMMQPIRDTGTGNGRRPGFVRTLSASDHDIFERAFDAADRGDWTAAKALADSGQNPAARKLIEWRYLMDRSSGAPFAEIAAFLRDNPDWPGHDTLLARAEQAIDPLTADPHAIIAWFGTRSPTTGIGKIRLGEALVAAGSQARGTELIREGWIEGTFDASLESQIILKDGALLTPVTDIQRLDQLLWRNEITAARRELARVPEHAGRIAAVRLALHTDPAKGLAAFDKLPASDQDYPALLFDEAHALRVTGAVDRAPQVLLRIPLQDMGATQPTRIWGEIAVNARQQISEGNYRTAYDLVKNPGLPPTIAQYAEAQFLAGWLALRFLNDPETALTHFDNLTRNVSRPISKARGHYWGGRAHEAAGNLAAAYRSYRLAAQNPETFYGELAMAKLEANPVLTLRSTAVDAATAAYEKDTLTPEIRVLADLGVDNLLRAFAVHAAEAHGSAFAKAECADLARMGFSDIAVRVAKTESYESVLLLPYLYPTIPVPAYVGPFSAPEAAYTLGIIRQETEFNPAAVSGPGAQGLMQVMPSTARAAANLAGIEYRPNDLLSDPTYNMRIGQVELSRDLDKWGGSYILAAAEYNAGPTNVRRWTQTYGDPRNSSVDPIDWIEKLPFEETRNYIQRVIENTEVYRTRLSGKPEPLRILSDIYRPNAPQTGVLHYTPASAQTAAPAQAAQQAQTPAPPKQPITIP